MSRTPYLIVNQTLKPPEELSDLLKVLAQKFGIDGYNTRQRLLGRGISLLASGPREQLEKIAGLLRQYGIVSWITAPTPPRFAPARVRGLEIGDDRLRFLTDENRVILERGDRVLAVLADLTGNLTQRNLEKLTNSTAYLGAATHLNRDEQYRTVLRNQPVLDLYLLDEENSIRQAVRLPAGRFDPSGLGERNTYGTGGNIDAVVQLVREYAGEFILHTDFGLTDLPGCALQPLAAGRIPEGRHLLPVTRFGWLMVDLYVRRQAEAKPKTDQAVPVDPVLGISAALPRTAATGGPATGIEALIESAADAAQAPPAEEPRPPRTLPTPPDIAPFRRSRFRWEWLLVFLFVAFGSGSLFNEIFERALVFGVRSGIAPALLSLLFGGLGLRNFSIKRHMENLPTSKIRSVAMGMVEVQGRARRKYALVSPMTQQPCVYYLLRKYRRDQENQTWRESGSVNSGPIPFDLEDRTGRLTVDPAGADIRVENSRTEGHGAMGLAITGVDDADEKWVEEVIPEGALVYVTGFARAPERTAGSLRERTIAALRELKRDPQRLRQYDADGDQQISEEEWQTARAEVEQQVLAEALDEPSAAASSPAPVVIGCPPRRKLPFIIAETRSEKKLARAYALNAAAQLVAGLGFGIFALTRLVLFCGGPG